VEWPRRDLEIDEGGTDYFIRSPPSETSRASSSLFFRTGSLPVADRKGMTSGKGLEFGIVVELRRG